jgi:hypothetical protein
MTGPPTAVARTDAAGVPDAAVEVGGADVLEEVEAGIEADVEEVAAEAGAVGLVADGLAPVGLEPDWLDPDWLVADGLEADGPEAVEEPVGPEAAGDEEAPEEAEPELDDWAAVADVGPDDPVCCWASATASAPNTPPATRMPPTTTFGMRRLIERLNDRSNDMAPPCHPYRLAGGAGSLSAYGASASGHAEQGNSRLWALGQSPAQWLLVPARDSLTGAMSRSATTPVTKE